MGSHEAKADTIRTLYTPAELCIAGNFVEVFLALLVNRQVGRSPPGKVVVTGNEDQFLIAELTKTMRISHTTLGGPPDVFGDERGYLFLVADGMGGADRITSQCSSRNSNRLLVMRSKPPVDHCAGVVLDYRGGSQPDGADEV